MHRHQSFDSLRVKHELIEFAHALIEYNIVLLLYVREVQIRTRQIHRHRRKHRMGTDPLAPIVQADNDLSTNVKAATTSIQNVVREILQATRVLKNPTTPVGEVAGLATNIENSAKAIGQLAVNLDQATASLTAAAGAAPTSIVATPNPIALDLNGAPTQQLSVIDSDSDDISADPSTVYSSDTPGVATVNATGSVTGVSVGSFNINITDEFNNTTTVPGTVADSPATGTAPAAQAKKKA